MHNLQIWWSIIFNSMQESTVSPNHAHSNMILMPLIQG